MGNRYLGYLRTRAGGVGLLVFIFAVLFILVPITGRYPVEIIIRLAILLILVVSYRLITSMGRWSFVHAQLFGMGAYASAICQQRLGYPFWLCFIIAGITAALIALILSYPLLRTKGFYFFMSTFVVGAAMIWVWRQYNNPFGGYNGLSGIHRPASISILGLTLDFNNYITWACLVLFLTLVCLLVLYRLEKTRLFTILKSIGSSRDLVRSAGINILTYEIAGFTIACFFAGLAGSLFVHHNFLASPTDFTATLGMNIIVYTIVGGVNSFWGALIGVASLTALGELLRSYGEIMPLIYGIIMIAMVLLLPDGLVSLPKRIKELKQGRASLTVEADKMPMVRDMVKRRRK